jgi:glycosyltransferase involved in cell wall biosynthesis
VLPCRNQADHIGRIVPDVIRALESADVPFELVLVPNASSDATESIVDDLARQDERIRVIPNPDGGWGRSVRIGLDAARGTILGYTNSARTEPASLPRFVERFRMAPHRLVKRCRIERQAPLRAVGSWLYNREARWLFGIRTSDVNGTPKLFAADFYRRLSLRSTGDLFDLELMVQAQWHGLEIDEIVLPGFRRHGGKSSTTLGSAWRMYLGALRLRLGLVAPEIA